MSGELEESREGQNRGGGRGEQQEPEKALEALSSGGHCTELYCSWLLPVMKGFDSIVKGKLSRKAEIWDLDSGGGG